METIIRKKTETKPPILVITKNHKRVALQLLQSIDICGRVCHLAQVPSLMACESKEDSVQFSTNPSLFEEMESNSILFVQLNIDTSISTMLYEQCRFRGRVYTNILANFNTMGSQLVSTNQGILTDRLGELGLLLACRAVLGQPIAATRKRCCHNLPIEIDNQVKYVTPVTRILTDNCDHTQCSRSYPIIFTISENISLCQFPDEIEICASPTFLDPATRLIPAKFVTLSDSENRIGNSFRWDQDIKSLIDNMLTDSMAQSSIFNTIAYNSRVCKNQDIFCPKGR